MKYSIVRLGTQAYFEGRTRDFVDEKDFEIENLPGTEHIVATSKSSGKEHFIPIYNVAYAEIKNMAYDLLKLENTTTGSPLKIEIPETFKQNDAANEIPNEVSSGTGADRAADSLSIVVGPEKRVKNPRKIDFFEGSFEKQIEFVKAHRDRALMAAQCTRRAAKSYSCGLHFFEDSKKFPGENYVYFTLTRETARKIFWKSVLKAIDAKFKVGCTFNESRLECTTPWGAQITCIGVDSDEREKEKVLGQKLRWGYGDESAFFNVDLEEMVYDMLLPATADLNGGVTLISTTSNRVNSFFHKITTGEVKGWDVHKWSYKDNPYTAKQVQALIDKIVSDNPLKATTPGFRQMYLNEWVIDLSALVYKFSRDKNVVYKKPDEAGFTYVIGIDLGLDDASSITVCGYNNLDKTLYILESHGKSGLDLTDVANLIKHTMKRYPKAPLVVDGANKQAVEEIIRAHGLPLIAAKKTDKYDHIQIMNSDFLTGNIKLVYDSCTELIEEYEELIWDERKLPGRHEELASKDNHRADATLYAWRYAYSYIVKIDQEPKNERDRIERWKEQERKKIEARSRSQYPEGF